jgi:hypothetical protein
MRSSLVYRALDRIPNRYTLCQTVSQSTRRLHIDGKPFEGTVSEIFKSIGDGVFHGRTTEAYLHQEESDAAPHEAFLGF